MKLRRTPRPIIIAILAILSAAANVGGLIHPGCPWLPSLVSLLDLSGSLLTLFPQPERVLDDLAAIRQTPESRPPKSRETPPKDRDF